MVLETRESAVHADGSARHTLFGGSRGAEIDQLHRGRPPESLGAPVSGYGSRSRFVNDEGVRHPRTPQAASSTTPLRDSNGIITASSLHYERWHHSGRAGFDPAAHIDDSCTELVNRLHGRRAQTLSVGVSNFSSVLGNTSGEWRARIPRMFSGRTVSSCSEWTGVWLLTLLRECGCHTGGS
jgi:hypothetical protein